MSLIPGVPLSGLREVIYADLVTDCVSADIRASRVHVRSEGHRERTDPLWVGAPVRELASRGYEFFQPLVALF